MNSMLERILALMKEVRLYETDKDDFESAGLFRRSRPDSTDVDLLQTP